MWVQKYRPETLDEYRGASSEKKELQEWIEDWEQGDKPVLLHGQAGTGKTSLVEALANDVGYELVETNASDVRTKKKLKEELKEATLQQSFYGGKKLILIDEVDGMSGNSDRGGVKEIGNIVDNSRFPVIMTANDAYDQSIRSLRNRAKEIKLDSVHTNSIAAHLREILDNEGIDYEDGAPKRIARSAGGQMRSAINDLQALALGREKLTVEDVKQQASRDDRQDIFDALKIVFKTSTASTANQATQNLDEDADTFLQWIRENAPREYQRSEDLARAYYWISEADLFNGRIRKRMNWKLMKYVFQFSTVGVALAKDEKYSGWTKYQYPSKIQRMGSSRAARNKLDSISSKMGEKLHMSQRDVKSSLPMFGDFLDHYDGLQGQLELEDEEVEFIHGF
ncbi:replication factor C large subunit [Candidatus Nanohalobium constans]|uniref:Replication factor C large subunit n=1 Tax=Candidatus Nanohalobium constans TaxID=2565781 RepID=A0A5Q0UFA3_9ARCH|nr:replication factor C large subunit [Candidatus Nanohalobium constans]QGA80257.1 replication factor C large subunit [Candidatus Nanohalobium constans]